MDKEQLLKVAKDKADEILVPAAKEYASFMLKDVALAAVEELVKDSKNPYDDMLWAALEPVLDAKLKEYLGE